MRHDSSSAKSKPNEPASRRRFGWLRDWLATWGSAWDKFWFTPSPPETLAVIRIFCGLMLAYVHFTWLFLLADFFGPNAWINLKAIQQLHANDYGWSWLSNVENMPLLYFHQSVAIAASLAMALGWKTRLAIPLVWWLTLMVCNRMTGALFGLDQVVMMLSAYLMWSNCGSRWSLDSLLKNPSRSGSWLNPSSMPSTWNTVVTRLIQLHLCVIYLFGGLSKMRGEMWWDGSAMWFALVNYEYQSLDLTWLGRVPFLIGSITAITIFWETFYCALVWPKLTRPLVLAMAVLVHVGIGAALGMWTFGTIMVVANMAFLQPDTVRSTVAKLHRKSERTN